MNIAAISADFAIIENSLASFKLNSFQILLQIVLILPLLKKIAELVLSSTRFNAVRRS